MSQNDFRAGRNHSTEQKASPMKQNPSVLGIDLAKRVFHIVGMDAQGHVVLRKRLAREALMSFIAQLPPVVIGMEACGGAHYWARRCREHGHEVKLMAPQFVKPYIKSNKHDPGDAEAICEAVTRPTMRFVPIKEVAQQDLQSLHRARERVVKARTALGNEIRGLGMEYGIVLPQGVAKFRHTFRATFEAERAKLTPVSLELFMQLYEEFCALDKRLESYNKKIEAIAAAHPVCQR
jgi:transposase